jgi:serine/threonine-protein phosphatase PGAM5
MATRTLYLVRHGAYHHVEIDSSDGYRLMTQAHEYDGGLTDDGRRQAAYTAHRVCHLDITTIHSSSLPRALETARIIAAELPAIPFRTTRILWETIPCVPPRLADHVADFHPDDLALGPAHAARAFERYFKCTRGTDKHDLIVCHGNLIRYFVCWALGVEVDAWIKMHPRYCGISEVIIKSNGRLNLMSYNDTGHLPPHLIG